MASDDLLRAAAEAVGKATSGRQLRDEMLRQAPLFHESLFRQKIAPGRRPELGMDLSTVPGRSGFTVKRGRSFFVSIGDETTAAEKRFTLAHELGHVLLASSGSRVPLSSAEAERLCERFASRAVAPLDQVEEYQRQAGRPEELADVERFVKHFGLTQRAAVVVIDSILPRRWPVAFLVASWRAHPKRPVMGVRIDVAAADSRLHFPRDTRLSSLGFHEMEAWALQRKFGSSSSGRDREIKVPSRGGLIPGWSGRSHWAAETQYAPGSKAEEEQPAVFCCVSVDELTAMPARPRPRSRAPVAKRPGQLSL